MRISRIVALIISAASFSATRAAAVCSVEIGVKPAAVSNDWSPTFGWATRSCRNLPITFECKLDSGIYTSCTSTKTYGTFYPGVSDGTHQFWVKVFQDGVAADTDTYLWVIDTVPPETSISGPSGVTTDSTPTFTLTSGPSTTFECRVDTEFSTGTYAACTTPHTLPVQKEGPRTLYVRAKDTAGNYDPTPDTAAFTIDLPETTMASGHPSGCPDNVPVFAFRSDDAANTFECRIDGGSWFATGCNSPYSFSGSAGQHTFDVRAKNSNASVDPSPAYRTVFLDGSGLMLDSFEAGKTPTDVGITQVHVNNAVSAGCIDASNSGATPVADPMLGQPFCTLKGVFQFKFTSSNPVPPGTAIRIHPGVGYDLSSGGNYFVDIEGTAALPIWIGGVETEVKPVFTGGSGLSFDAPLKYVIFHYMNITGSNSHLLNIADGGGEPAYRTDGLPDPNYDYDHSRYVIARDLDLSFAGNGDSTENCLKMSGVNDFVVRHNTFYRCGMSNPSVTRGDGVDFVGCHHGLVERNIFETRKAVQMKGGSEDIEVRWNYATYIDEGTKQDAVFHLGESTGDSLFRPPIAYGTSEGRNLRLTSNIVRGGYAALRFNCDDCLVANNTIIEPLNWVARYANEHSFIVSGVEWMRPMLSAKFINNIVRWDGGNSSNEFNVTYTPTPGEGLEITSAQAATFTVRNNLWHNYTGGGAAGPNYDGLSPTSGTEILDNPAFVDLTNYQILTSSPAHTNAGLSLSEVKAGHPQRIDCPTCALGYDLDMPVVCFSATTSRGARQATP